MTDLTLSYFTPVNWSNTLITYDAILGWLLTSRGGNMEVAVSEDFALAAIKLLKQLNTPKPQLP